MLKLNAFSTVEEISAYLAMWCKLATKVYREKKLIIAFSYKCGTEYRFRAVKCSFTDIKPYMVSVCEKSFSSRHVSYECDVTYKLRLENVKNGSIKGSNDSFVKQFFNNECVFDIDENEFFTKFELFKSMYGHGASAEISAQRAKAKRQKKGENTEMTLTVGHFTEWLINPENYKINVKTVKNGYDYKDKNGNTYEIKTCYSKVKYNGQNYSFGGSTIELSKDF